MDQSFLCVVAAKSRKWRTESIQWPAPTTRVRPRKHWYGWSYHFIFHTTIATKCVIIAIVVVNTLNPCTGEGWGIGQCLQPVCYDFKNVLPFQYCTWNFSILPYKLCIESSFRESENPSVLGSNFCIFTDESVWLEALLGVQVGWSFRGLHNVCNMQSKKQRSSYYLPYRK